MFAIWWVFLGLPPGVPHWQAGAGVFLLYFSGNVFLAALPQTVAGLGVATLLVTGCSSDSSASADPAGGGEEIAAEAWVRPRRAHRPSGVAGLRDQADRGIAAEAGSARFP